MKSFLLISAIVLLAGCNKSVEPPAPQTSSADQAMQASKDAAHSAVQDAQRAASEASEAAKQATTALAEKSKQAASEAKVAAKEASTEAKQATDKVVTASKETADQAMTAAKEATNKAATATENAAQEVAASTAPTTIPDWVVMPKYDCRACHAIDRKLVGPAWKDVAEKYKGDPTAEARLMEKVRKGGKGNWDKVTGGVSMPSHPALSDADLKRVLDFELSLAK